MTIQLWSEGYSATGQSAGASFHGEFECDTLQKAVKLYRDSLTDKYSRDCIDLDNLTNWACRFFDNESDARKSFG